MSPADLGGKAAIITGAGSGIGRACAQALSQAGANVVLFGRRSGALAESVALLDPRSRAIPIPGDVADEGAVGAAVERTLDEFGRIDILILAAGVGLYGPAEDYSLANWNETIATNLTGAFLFSRTVIPAMRAARSGQIVAIGSGAGREGYPNLAAYCASKFGFNGLMQSLAAELGPASIRVGVVQPGSILTDFGGSTAGAKETSAVPGKHYLDADDVAQAVMTMLRASDRAWIQEVQIWPFS